MSTINLKLSGLKEYEQAIGRLHDNSDLFFRQATKELAARLLRKVIKRTPVGVKPKLAEDKKNTIMTVETVGSTTVKKKVGNGVVTFQRKRKMKRKMLTPMGAAWAGYSGGTLRRGWTAKTEAEAKNGSGKSGDVLSYLEGVAVIKEGSSVSYGSSYHIVLINPVKYASYVEYGHRQTPGRFVPAIGKKLKKPFVEGKFMLRISEEELQKQAPAILQRRLTKFLRGLMDNGK